MSTKREKAALVAVEGLYNAALDMSIVACRIAYSDKEWDTKRYALVDALNTMHEVLYGPVVIPIVLLTNETKADRIPS